MGGSRSSIRIITGYGIAQSMNASAWNSNVNFYNE